MTVRVYNTKLMEVVELISQQVPGGMGEVMQII